MKKYFKFIGILEIICVAIIVLVYICLMISSFFIISKQPLYLFERITTLILLCIIGPAVGLLFISHSNLLTENPDITEKNLNLCKTKKRLSKKRYENFKVGDFVDCVDFELIDSYKIKKSGTVVSSRDDIIYVKFEGENGHYTLQVSNYQIEKSKTSNI